MAYSIQPYYFDSAGTKCSGLLYKPARENRPPVIIMAHGFACQQDFALPMFAKRFAAEGIAVFTFDYRHFGKSDGSPRHLLSISKQKQDWKAAIRFVRTLKDLDHENMILWGSSLSGGHVLVTASEDPGIKLVLSHVPFADGWTALSMMRFWDSMRLTLAAMWDLVCQLSHRTYYIPVVESPGKLGCMTNQGVKESYLAMVPPDSSWENKCAARISFPLPLYRPCRQVSKITCPVLMIAGDHDNAVSTPASRKAARKIRCCAYETFPMGHFDCYVPGPFFEQLLRRQLAFIKENLCTQPLNQ